MKFGHVLNEALAGTDYPPEWVSAAIRYKNLKKCIKKVQKELEGIGLPAELLQSILDRGTPTDGNGRGVLKYWFHGTLKEIAPVLVLKVDPEGGIPVDLELEENTRKALEEIVRERAGYDVLPENIIPDSVSRRSASSKSDSSSDEDIEEVKRYRYCEIPITADTEFFHLLTSELSDLEELQAKEEENLKRQIEAIVPVLTDVASPALTNPKSDLYPWREIFRMYLDAGIFFTVTETRMKEASGDTIGDKLTRFSSEVQESGVLTRFKHPQSMGLWQQFVNVNMSLVRLLRFQEINKTAITKILKKFDKRTALNSRLTFPKLLASEPLFAKSVSKALCYTINSRLMPLVPQLDDYLCPICSSLAFKPIHLACHHVFCIRCLVKLQRQGKKSCPLCRQPVVHKATGANVDTARINFLMLYFPEETKEKKKENQKEVEMELTEHYKKVLARKRKSVMQEECVIM